MVFLEVVTEIFHDIVVDGILQYPGAAIRWLFLRKKKTFKELLKNDFELNALISVLVIALIVSIVYQIIK